MILSHPIRFFLSGLLATAVAWAAPKDDIAANQAARKDAIQLFRSGNAAQALAQLRSNVKAEARGGDKTIEVAQQLVDMAFYFSARHETALARQAVDQSIGESLNLLKSRKVDPQVANLFCNIGLACDRILKDPVSSQAYYSAALLADSSNTIAGERLQIVGEKAQRSSPQN